MIISDKKNETELMAFVPSIKSNMADWQIISVHISPKGQDGYDATLRQLLHIYEHREGIILPVNDRKIVLLVRLGNVESYDHLTGDIKSKLPEHDAHVIAQRMSTTGLKQVQLNLTEKTDEELPAFYEDRMARQHNIFLVAEDDAFVRQALGVVLKEYGEVVEAENGSNVRELYTKHNPNIVMLDIHMPHKDGLTLVNELKGLDPNAFIVIVSADSVRENVIEATSGGAMGFLTKPIQKDKLLEYLQQCATCTAIAS